ncbi:hypothetical protein [Companilactobacillus zhachilii]|nr:hypothetical protein [Companilactobacillus zhachilii]
MAKAITPHSQRPKFVLLPASLFFVLDNWSDNLGIVVLISND